jgi:hypothetical protein
MVCFYGIHADPAYVLIGGACWSMLAGHGTMW